MANATAPTPAAPSFKILPDTAGVLAIQLSGAWKIATGVPDPTPAIQALREDHPRQLKVSGESLGEWDSALLGFLLPIARTAREQKVAIDVSGLPAGTQKLLGLALAEPVKEATRDSESGRGGWEVLKHMFQNSFAQIRAELDFLGEITLALLRFLRGKGQLRLRDFFLQLQECGAEALPIVVLIGFLVGAIIGFVGATVLETYGAAIYTANMVAIAVTRELGALMTAIILSGRTGAAFAANLGTMKTNEELDALQTVGLRPIDFLVIPRFLALGLTIPLLTAFADLAGITGGLLVATTMPNVTIAAYINATLKTLTTTHILIGLGKSILFGAIIALVGCRRGLECGRSAAGVGLAATSAVVVSITLIIALDGILAVVFNALKI